MIKQNPNKKYLYKIGEVAEIFNVNVSLIRYYEKEFSIIKPKRNKKGNRFFTQADLDNFHKIFHLIKEEGHTLEGAKAKLSNIKSQSEEKAEVVQTLLRTKQFLLELRKHLG